MGGPKGRTGRCGGYSTMWELQVPLAPKLPSAHAHESLSSASDIFFTSTLSRKHVLQDSDRRELEQPDDRLYGTAAVHHGD